MFHVHMSYDSYLAFLGQGWAFCGEDSLATLRGSLRSVRYCE